MTSSLQYGTLFRSPDAAWTMKLMARIFAPPCIFFFTSLHTEVTWYCGLQLQRPVVSLRDDLWSYSVWHSATSRTARQRSPPPPPPWRVTWSSRDDDVTAASRGSHASMCVCVCVCRRSEPGWSLCASDTPGAFDKSFKTVLTGLTAIVRIRLFVSDRSEKSDRRSFILSGPSWDMSERSVSGLRPFWHTGTWTSIQHGGSR